MFPCRIGDNRYIDGGYRRNENADMGVNADIAVGALLTSTLDGYRFEGTQTTSCPVNNHGVLVG